VKVLVTGGAGFIGSHLVRALLERGDEVTVIDDFSTGLERRMQPYAGRIRLVQGDVRDPAAMERAMAGCEAVLHEAAVPSVARSVRDPLASNSVNSDGTIQVMLAAGQAGCRRVVFAGSSAVYGASPELPRRETQLPDPRSPYAVSKLAAEGYVHSIGSLIGVETVVLRYFNIFGPDQDPLSEYAAVVPRFMTAALRREPVTVHGDGKQSRDFTYVENVVRANLLALDREGASGLTCNIGCGGRYTLLDLIAAIQSAVGWPVQVEHGLPRPGDVPHSQAAIDVAHERLGYEVVVPFEEGIERSVAWYGSNLAQPAA
jgi:UDP-N-acetylglucosamine/UDP-N-acetyl-alpha-D-glucosaminouronate 4-epimerase